MEITAKHKSILSAEVCPYCNSTTKVVSEEFIYGKKYSGRSIVCCDRFPTCDAFVGCHSDGTPLGRLANKHLRASKINAHNAFDRIWKDCYMTRTEAYEWLSDELGIDEEYTHIGMFSIKTCQKVVELSNKFINEHT